MERASNQPTSKSIQASKGQKIDQTQKPPSKTWEIPGEKKKKGKLGLLTSTAWSFPPTPPPKKKKKTPSSARLVHSAPGSRFVSLLGSDRIASGAPAAPPLPAPAAAGAPPLWPGSPAPPAARRWHPSSGQVYCLGLHHGGGVLYISIYIYMCVCASVCAFPSAVSCCFGTNTILIHTVPYLYIYIVYMYIYVYIYIYIYVCVCVNVSVWSICCFLTCLCSSVFIVNTCGGFEP